MADAAPAGLGWDDAMAAELATVGEPRGSLARVARVDRKWCTVWTAPAGDGHRLPAPEDLVVGDWVLLPEPLDRVAERVPRKSALARRAADGSAAAQVIAANVDRVVIVHSLVGGPNPRRLERELVITYESGAEPVIVLTKVDLVDDPGPGEALARDVGPGVPVLVVNALTGDGVAGLGRFTAGHRTIVLIGPSGAGKSTLTNALLGAEVQPTAAVRAADQRGRHTTTAAELIVLPDGGLLIDTPGLRAVALWSEGAGLEEAFADVVAVAEHCRFRDCRHDVEPGCAVRAAVEAGALTGARVHSWQHLHRELEVLQEEQAAAGRAARRGRRPPRRGGSPVAEG